MIVVSCSVPGSQRNIDRVDHALWTTWQPSAIPCFTIELLRELRAASAEIERRFSSPTISPLRYIIIRSAVANVFNLGGDLAYFARLIEAQDEAGLAEYANLAVDVTFRNYTGHNLPNVTTIALLEGDALGGGFESALSCDLVIAEKHVKAGFPEVLFNMFPGMGGLSFLARRTSRQIVNEVTRSGRLYSAQELYDFGIVDMVVESGEAVTAARRLLRQRYQQHEAHSAMNVVDRLIRPVARDELDDVVRLWVDSALRLTVSRPRVDEAPSQAANAGLRPQANAADRRCRTVEHCRVRRHVCLEEKERDHPCEGASS